MNLQDKYNLLKEILADLGKVIVAYSGGVDSTFLLKAAVDTLGAENVAACIAAGPSLPKKHYQKAVEMAKDMGVDVKSIEPNELADMGYSANKADRCFHCKSHLFKTLSNVAKQRGFANIVYGSNYDDKDDYRPGHRAAEAFGIRAPLAEAKLTKEDIRQLSRDSNLPTADAPASPCLASRISYGLEITDQRLKQIEEAEEFLCNLGFVEFRVRHHDTTARIEVHAEDIEKIITKSIRSQIVEKLKSLGFTFVTLDMKGFRSGSLNEGLTEKQKRANL